MGCSDHILQTLGHVSRLHSCSVQIAIRKVRVPLKTEARFVSQGLACGNLLKNGFTMDDLISVCYCLSFDNAVDAVHFTGENID